MSQLIKTPTHSSQTIVAIPQHIDLKVQNIPTATPDMLNKRKIALSELRALGGLHDIISDPMAWQQEMRTDRSLLD